MSSGLLLISDNLLYYVKISQIKPGYKTDHSIITFTIDNLKAERGPGYFKLNNSLLLENEYQTKIKECIQETLNFNKDANPNTLWEIQKVRLETQQ